MSQTLFVTGTDTEVGKTVVSVALLRALAKAGVTATGFKPVASGAEPYNGLLANPDALALHAASAPGVNLQALNPVVFEPAIAPHLAAARLGQRIAPAVLTAAHAALAQRYDAVVAEGAGGWLTPLNDDTLLGDWVAERGWPVLLVVRLKLGCLSHALLSAEAIKSRGLPLAGWVANHPHGAGPEWRGMLDTLSARLGPPLWVQRGFEPAPEAVARGLFTRG